MTIVTDCREILADRPDLRIPERHFELWLEYNIRHRRLPREAAALILDLHDRFDLANYESVRRASREIIHE